MSYISDINWVFFKYYGDNPELRRIVTIHSEQVAKKALQINKDKKLGLDPKTVYCAAMLHDIGVVKCDAPGMGAKGNLPYLRHGLEGAKILHDNGFSQFSKICLTHIGAGISKSDIIENKLPLPRVNFLPGSLLEKLICYSDKFYSKSKDLLIPKDFSSIEAQIKKFGEGSYNRFMELHRLFN